MIRSRREKTLALTLVAVALAVFFVLTRGSGSTSPLGERAQGTVSADTSVARRHLPAIAAGSGMAIAGGAIESILPMAPTHVAGPKCESCSVENCVAATDGCDRIADLADRKLCEDLYECFADPAHDCLTQGDPVKCWCGTNPTTCLTENTGPRAANGPCAEKISAGARSTDPQTIRARFVDPDFPLGSAVNLILCRGSWCSDACKVH